jgi:hypothetical protein
MSVVASLPIPYNEWAFDKLYESFKSQGIATHKAHELAVALVDLLTSQPATTMQNHLTNAIVVKKAMKSLVDELYLVV